MDQEDPVKSIPPYKVLFVQNIPASYTDEKLMQEWNVPGLIEVRLIPSRHCGFAEFEDDTKATAALELLSGRALSDGTHLIMNYAKR